eukprot:5288316-Lingulodinium_polyedra.AAC.1
MATTGAAAGSAPAAGRSGSPAGTARRPSWRRASRAPALPAENGHALVPREPAAEAPAGPPGVG